MNLARSTDRILPAPLRPVRDRPIPVSARPVTRLGARQFNWRLHQAYQHNCNRQKPASPDSTIPLLRLVGIAPGVRHPLNSHARFIIGIRTFTERGGAVRSQSLVFCPSSSVWPRNSCVSAAILAMVAATLTTGFTLGRPDCFFRAKSEKLL